MHFTVHNCLHIIFPNKYNYSVIMGQITVCTFQCDALNEDDYVYIAGTLGLGELETKVYIQYMRYWKNGNEADCHYASTIASRIKDVMRDGFYGRFERYWAIILYNIIQNEIEKLNPNNWKV